MTTIIPSLSISLAPILSSFPSSLSNCLYMDYFHMNFFHLAFPSSNSSYSLLFIIYLFLSIYFSVFLFMSPECCLDLILIVVGMRDIRLITTSFPWNRCFRVNDHWCEIAVTFQVQGRITMWLILTQNLSEQKTPNLLSKLLCLLLFQRLLIQWHSFITCEL